MAIFKKINRETGEEALRYIVYDQEYSEENQSLYFDIYHFFMGKMEDIGCWDYRLDVGKFNGSIFVVITWLFDYDLKYCAKMNLGDIIMPFYIGWVDAPDEYHVGDFDLQFDKSRTYTPKELEALYPSALYDTVEVKQ